MTEDEIYDGLKRQLDDDDDNGIHEYPPCVPEFVGGYNIVNEYQEWMCKALINYGREGLFIEGFAGKHNINQMKFNQWITAPDGEYEALKAARNICFSASIHVWCSRLNHAVRNADWQAVEKLKAIIADIMKSVPKHFREGMADGYVPKDPEEEERLKRVEKQSRKKALLEGKKNV